MFWCLSIYWTIWAEKWNNKKKFTTAGVLPLLVFIYCSFAWWYYTCITLYFYYELYEKLQDMLRGALTCNGYTVEGHKVKFLPCILKRDKAEYWQLTPSLLYIAVVLLHTRSWSDFLQSCLPQHGHRHLFLGSNNLQSPYSDTCWFDLKKIYIQKKKKKNIKHICRDKLHLGCCILFWVVLTLNLLTIAVLPHVTVGAARCVALRPSADAVLCYPLLLSQTLQCMHFAHIQKDWLSTRSSSSTHLQRWTGDKKSWSSTKQQQQQIQVTWLIND